MRHLRFSLLGGRTVRIHASNGLALVDGFRLKILLTRTNCLFEIETNDIPMGA
jgi:hypothetical protein